jgi:holo-[acyl-carrier protein] synthase
MEGSRETGILGLGLDLVDVERLRKALDRSGDRFARRVFTVGEQAYCTAKADPVAFYAARFAAKEAVAKAFGTGIGAAIGWLDIEVVRNSAGVPGILLSGKGALLAAQRGVTRVLLSLTHSGGMAAASVVLTRE